MLVAELIVWVLYLTAPEFAALDYVGVFQTQELCQIAADKGNKKIATAPKLVKMKLQAVCQADTVKVST